MTTRTLKTDIYQSLEELPIVVNEFWQEQSRHDYFIGRSWFDNFINNVANQDGSVRIYVVTHGEDGVQAILPLWIKSNTKYFGATRIVTSLSNYYSPYFRLILNNSADAETTINELITHIKHDLAIWDAMLLGPVDVCSVNNYLFVEALKKQGLSVKTYFACANWIIDLNDTDFTSYFKSRPSKLRHTYQRRQKKLAHDYQFNIKVFSDLTDLEEAIADYQTIYSKSWKVKEPYVNFIPNLIRTCAKDGVLRLGILYVNNIPAAAQIWILNRKSASIYKLAYDPLFKDYSVGTILTMYLAERMITDEGMSRLDYLTGDDSYKKDWMNIRREFMCIYVINKENIRGRYLILKENLSVLKNHLIFLTKLKF